MKGIETTRTTIQNPYGLPYQVADYVMQQPQQQQTQVSQVPDRRAMLLQELKANEARIAELETKLSSLESGMRSTADSFDMKMAENRARQGDFSNSMWHWARPDQRKQQESNRIKEVEFQISDIDNQISKLRLAKSYENNNRAAADEYDRAIDALESKKAMLMKKAGINPGFSFNFVNYGKNGNDDTKYKQEVLARYNASLMTGADGKTYLKPDADRASLLADLKKIPHWSEDPTIMEIVRKVEESRNVDESVSANTYENLKNFVNNPKNYSKGVWLGNARDEFNRLVSLLPKEERAKANELVKKFGKKMTETEYAKYLEDMDKAGREVLASLPKGGVKEQVDNGYTNKFTDTRTGLEWVKGQDGKWSAKGWKRG